MNWMNPRKAITQGSRIVMVSVFNQYEMNIYYNTICGKRWISLKSRAT